MSCSFGPTPHCKIQHLVCDTGKPSPPRLCCVAELPSYVRDSKDELVDLVGSPACRASKQQPTVGVSCRRCAHRVLAVAPLRRGPRASATPQSTTTVAVPAAASGADGPKRATGRLLSKTVDFCWSRVEVALSRSPSRFQTWAVCGSTRG